MRYTLKEFPPDTVPQPGEAISELQFDASRKVKRITFLAVGKSTSDAECAATKLGLRYLGSERLPYSGAALKRGKYGVSEIAVPEYVAIADGTAEQRATRAAKLGYEPKLVDAWVYEVRATAPKGWVQP